jgi:hypothetical protein
MIRYIIAHVPGKPLILHIFLQEVMIPSRRCPAANKFSGGYDEKIYSFDFIRVGFLYGVGGDRRRRSGEVQVR